MPRRITEVVVLAEDMCQSNLVRHYLARAGIAGSVRIKQSPMGRGSGAQYVLENYPIEVRNHRRQISRRSAALIAVIDADNLTVGQRRDGLARKLDEAGLDDRDEGEPIGILVPRRHIETWVSALNGRQVSEDQDCKKFGCKDAKEAARRFYDFSRPNAPEPPLDSLRLAVPEIRRIEI